MAELARIAARLARRAHSHSAGHGRTLPSLWLFTDPDRTPDPLALAAHLPRGAGVVHRTFGRAGAEAAAGALAQLAHRRGLILLIGADPDLAASVGAAGVHLPDRGLGAARLLQARRPGWIVTGAAHSARALARGAAAGLDAAFLSAAFPSASPSAGAPLGPVRLARLIAEARLPVYALGGVAALTARRLEGTGAAGFAAVDAFRA